MSKITIDRAVLETALEALKKCDTALSEELAAWDIDPPLHHVLEASNACGPSIAVLREALAQPQQEPVAAFDEGLGRPRLLRSATILSDGQPLHTSPSTRKLLTDEQWLSVGRQARDAFFGCKQDNVLSQIDCAAHAAMRATESAHGIKETK